MSAQKTKVICLFCTHAVCEKKYVAHMVAHCTNPMARTNVVIHCVKCNNDVRGDHIDAHEMQCKRCGHERALNHLTVHCPHCKAKLRGGEAIATHSC